MTGIIVLDIEMKKDYSKISNILLQKLNNCKTNRSLQEQEWLNNLNQYNCIYDDETKIDKNRSHWYPAKTRSKIHQLLARVINLIFPDRTDIFQILPTEEPSLNKSLLVEIINKLISENNFNGDDKNLKDAIYLTALNKAKNLESRIKDHLQEIDIIDLYRNLLLNCFIFGTAVAKGPIVNVSKKNKISIKDNQIEINEVEEYKPVFEFVNLFDFYPDMSSKSFNDCDFVFFRTYFNRKNLLDLRYKKDYIKENITSFVEENESNYKETEIERKLRSSTFESNVSNKNDNKFEVYEYHGYIKNKLLKEIGYDIEESELIDSSMCEVHLLNDTIIKFIITNRVEKPWHIIKYYNSLDQLFGKGICHFTNKDQAALNAASRALVDNMAINAGPIVEVATHLLSPSQKNLNEIKPFMIIRRDDDDASTLNAPAIRSTNINSNINEILAVRREIDNIYDQDSNLSNLGVGDFSGMSEAARTSSGVSQLLTANNQILKDITKQIDNFTIPLINSIIEFYSVYNAKDDDIFGDLKVIALASTSIVNKQIRSNQLQSLINTLPNDFRNLIKQKELLKELLYTYDLNPTEIIKNDIELEQERKYQEQIQMQMQNQEIIKQELEKEKVLSEVNKNNAIAEKTKEESEINSIDKLSKVVSNNNNDVQTTIEQVLNNQNSIY